MDGTRYVETMAQSLNAFFKELVKCGICTTFSANFKTQIMDEALMNSFKSILNILVVNILNLMKGLPGGNVNGNATKNGSTEIKVVDFSDINIAQKASSKAERVFANGTTQQIKVNDSSSGQKSVSNNVVNIIRTTDKKEIKEAWQLSILENEEPETAIDTIAEVMVKNVQRGVGWQCDICSESFNKLQNLQNHYVEIHEGVGCFECHFCSTRLKTKTSLKRHLRWHSGIRSSTCTICDKTFRRQDYLLHHYKLHKGAMAFKCESCSKEFATRSNLKVHLKIHSNTKDYQCNQCQKRFKRRDKLRDHVLRHLNIKRFQCSHCGKRYAEKRDLRTHLSKVEMEKETLN